MENYPTSLYITIIYENSDIKVAISDVDISGEIDIPYIKKHSDLIKNADFTIIDTNLSQTVIDYLFQYFPVNHFIVDTVSVTKSTII